MGASEGLGLCCCASRERLGLAWDLLQQQWMGVQPRQR